MTTVMPQTAGQAEAVARQHYRAMLHHAAAGNVYLTQNAAGCFQNACALAQMYELRQIRIGMMRLLRAQGLGPDDDSRDWHPAAPRVPHDGHRVVVPGRRWQ